MSEAFKFDPVETEMIVRMYKQRMPSRQIAKVIGRPLIEVHKYVNDVLAKDVQKQKAARILPAAMKERARERLSVRRYEDPLAAAEGSRKLLEALHAYSKKYGNNT
jgi:hypothetical protein